MSAGRPLRISIIQGAFLPIPPMLGGAVEKQWMALGQEFAARGHDVVHISRRFQHLPNEEIVNGVVHRRVSGFTTPASLLLLKAQDFLYSLRATLVLRQSDIIVTNTFWAPMLIPFMRKGRVYVDFARMPKGQVPFYLKSARLRVPSSAVAEAILQRCPAARPIIKVIPNLLSFTRTAVNMDAKEHSILYAGRIHPEKGLELLLAAFLSFIKDPVFKDWSLDLVGPAEIAEGGGGRNYLAALKRQFAHASIHWHGPVYDSKELVSYYTRAALFCYPSLAHRGETFGVAPLEAMAWGAVPIVSELACFKDFIHTGENGLVFDHKASGSVELLAEQIRRLVLDKPFREQLAFSALNVWKTHSSNCIASLFLDDFQSLVSR